MNIFENKSSFTGSVKAKRMERTYLEFFDLSKEIKRGLSEKGYLMDKYLSCLFSAVSIIKSCAENSSSAGFHAGSELIGYCIKAMRYEEEKLEDALYEQVKEFICAHPLSFQERQTKNSTYFALLTNDYLKAVIENYEKELITNLDAVLDISELRGLYRQICDMLGSEEKMEEINHLFRQRFLSATPMSIFLQSLNDQLLCALTYHDAESSKQVFQLLLNLDLLG